MSLNSDWVLTSAQLPPRPSPSADLSDPVEAVVVQHFTARHLTLVQYSFAHEYWTDGVHTYGLSALNWVSHWRPTPPLPPPVSREAILAHIQRLEPVYPEITMDVPLRALFADVDPADQPLQDQLFKTIAFTGIQGTAVRGRGKLKGNRYYIDFWVHEALQLRQVRLALATAPVAWTIDPR